MGQRAAESVNGGGGSTRKTDGEIRVRPASPGASPDKRAEEICSEIDRTRSNMSGTLGELEERLSPSRMKEQVLEQFHDAKERIKSEVRGDILEMKHSIRQEIDEAKLAMRDATIGRVEHLVHDASETINETGSTLMSTIRDNPIPLLLTGIGVTWLFMNARNERARVAGGARGRDIGVRDVGGMVDRGQRALSQAAHSVQDVTGRAVHNVRDAAGNLVDHAGAALHDAEDRVETMAQEAGHTVSNLAHQAEETVGQYAHDAQDRATTLAKQTRIRAIRAEEGAEALMRDNPLAVGAAAFALGAAVGLALPHTQREDDLIGAARDQFLKKAQHLAEDAVGAAREKIEDLVQSQGPKPATHDATSHS